MVAKNHGGFKNESFSKILRPSSPPCEVYMEHINLDSAELKTKWILIFLQAWWNLQNIIKCVVFHCSYLTMYQKIGETKTQFTDTTDQNF